MNTKEQRKHDSFKVQIMCGSIDTEFMSESKDLQVGEIGDS